jgi:hypothetical protein
MPATAAINMSRDGGNELLVLKKSTRTFI